MGSVVKLVPCLASEDTVDALAALLEEARAGEVVGLTYVALHRGRKFTADVVGDSKQSLIFTLGTIQCLNNYLLALSEDK